MKRLYPKEYYINLTNNENLQARIVIILDRGKFNAQIDITQKENDSIFKHIGQMFGYSNEEELLSLAKNKIIQTVGLQSDDGAS